MIKLLLIPGFFMMSCGATKNNRELVENDSLIVTQPVSTKDSAATVGNKAVLSGLPPCIKNKIDSFKLKESHEMPQKVVEYTYRDKPVYYVVMPCCDFFNEVYDETCKYLGAPDGGFTGKGDGKIPDFFTAAKEKQVVWQAGK